MTEATDGYTEDQLKNMLKQLANDLRVAQEEAKTASKSNAELQQKERERAEYIQKLETNVNQVKEEKKQVYGEILEKDITPYFTKMKQAANDQKLVTAIEQMEQTLKTGHENAFMEPEQQNTLRFVSAVASADAIRSSDLERLLTSEQEWGVKYESLQKQKEELETANAAKQKEYEEANSLKEQMVNDLKAELEKLKGSINNTEGHFSNKAAVEEENKPMETEPAAPAPSTETTAAAAPVVAATASGSSTSNGIDSIFDFRRPALFSFEPRSDWRTSYPDPGNGHMNKN